MVLYEGIMQKGKDVRQEKLVFLCWPICNHQDPVWGEQELESEMLLLQRVEILFLLSDVKASNILRLQLCDAEDPH